MMRTQIPRFRLPDSEVIDEETGYILDLGVEFSAHAPRREHEGAARRRITTPLFVGSGAPRGRDLDIPGRKEAAENIHIGIDWLSSCRSGMSTVDRQARDRAGRRQYRDGLLPLRAPARRRDVKVVVRSGFDEMKASPWEKEDAMHEGIPIHQLPGAEGIQA
jgi:formate dehydrogenase beta subunit